MNFSTIPFEDKYYNHIFIIHPFIKKTDNCETFGSIITPKNKWDQIIKLLSKSKYTLLTNKIYIYRDLEYSIRVSHSDEYNNLSTVIHKKTCHTDIQNEYLLAIYKYELLDDESFPKFNRYHDEYEKIERKYTFGTVDMNLVTIKKNDHTNEYNYIELSFVYKKKIANRIPNDLEYIKQLIS